MPKHSTLKIRLTDEESRKIALLAASARMSKSAFCRLALLSGAAPDPARGQPAEREALEEVRDALLALAAEIRDDRRRPYPAEWAVRRNAEGLGAGLDPFTQRIAGVIDWAQVHGGGRWPAADDPGLLLPPAARKDWPHSLAQAQALVAEKMKSTTPAN